MKNSRDRAILVMGGALMQSGFSKRELLDIAKRLTDDPSFTDQLSHLVFQLTPLTSLSPVGTKPPRYDAEPETFVEELIDMFAKRRMRKADALLVLKKTVRGLTWVPRPSQTLRDNIFSLSRELSSSKEADALRVAIAGVLGVSADPYLRRLHHRR